MAKFGFDTTDVQPDAPINYDPIPEGEYVLKAVDAEEKETKSRDGSYINVKFEVVKGEYAGRLLWHMFNIHNPSEKAQRIGRQQLVAWATACGKPDADDTDKLLEKQFSADVMIQAASGGYAASNRIKAFLFNSEKKSSAKSESSKKPEPEKSSNSSSNPWD